MATKPPAASSMSAGTVSAPVPAVTSAGGTAGGTAGGPAAAGTATGTGGGTLDGSTTAGADQQTRGLPYYEKLRRELRETIQKKRLLDKNMVCE
ncbi:Chromatin modification- protein meaf6 [Ascosphaera aggregata]|nr:Chromatin modification- protein meaf6 [Ascosphaera aggregata]